MRYLLFATAVLAADPMLFPNREGSKIGFIDRSGEVIVSPRFDSTGEFSEGLARVSTGSVSGYIDAAGKMRIEPRYTVAPEFVDDRAIVMTEDGKYSIIDRTGRTIASIPYRPLGRFHQGLCKMQRPRGEKTPVAYGYFDRNGRTVIEPQFINAGDFSDGPDALAIVIKDHAFYYIDRSGRAVLKLSIDGNDRAPAFKDGLVKWKEDGWWGYRDAKGEWAIKPQFDYAADFADGPAQVTLKGQTNWINTRGERQEPPKFQKVAPLAEGFAVIRDNSRLGYLNEFGRPAFELPMLQTAYSFSGGLVRVKMDGKFGFIDTKGNWALKPQYSDASDFKGGLARVMFAEGNWGHIDATGKRVWESAKTTRL
ncbi:MAG: WG repeat-containing protein [Acidobacteria bacterium]|nr:WG repeat-containing protein [Acidobacteriota bacterium]